MEIIKVRRQQEDDVYERLEQYDRIADLFDEDPEDSEEDVERDAADEEEDE